MLINAFLSVPQALRGSLLLSTLWLAGAAAALAQTPTTVSLPAGKPRRTPVQVQVYDSTLHLLGEHTVQLRGKCTLFDTKPRTSNQLAAFEFRQHNTGADSVFLLAFNADGRPTGLLGGRRHITGRNRTTPLDLPTADLLVKGAGSTRRSFIVQSLLPSLNLRWEQRFVAPKGAARLNASAADATHVWLLLTEHANSRRNTPVAVCLDAATGRQLSRTPLGTGPGLREAATCTINPDHSLTIAGHAFKSARPANARMGDLFVLHLSPEGRVLNDQQLPIGALPRRHKVLWEQVQPTPNGGVRLVGETYTKTSAGATMAFYAATWAATYTYAAQTQTVLRPRGLLLLDLDASGKVKKRQLVELPKGGSLYKGRYLAARRMAREAAQKGTFRYRATAPGNVTLLRTKTQLLEVKPGVKTPIPLREQAKHTTQDIVGTSGQHLLVTEYNEKKKQFSLLRVPYKPATAAARR